MRLAVLGLALAAAVVSAQDRRPQLDIENYKIAVEVDPAAQTLRARAEVLFRPVEDNTTSAIFELNNALHVTSVTDASGAALSHTRNAPDFTVRVNFPAPLGRTQAQTLVFNYEGRLSGQEESPVYGIRFASIQSEYAYLLYPSRWFPVSGYTSDRYTAEIRVTAPTGFRALGGAIERQEGGVWVLQTLKPGFAGSIALVRGGAQRVSSQGFTSEIYARNPALQHAQAVGDEIGKVMVFLTGIFGLAPSSNLVVVETDEGAPGGYSAAGMLFLSPGSFTAQPSNRLLANQLTRQWFGNLFSAVNRNHLWIQNGMAKYAELLYQEHLNGAAALEAEARDVYIDAMTVTDIPVRQAARLEDYSPEQFALTGSRGAAVYHMLRWMLGDEPFQKALKTLPDLFAYKSIGTDDLRKAFEAVYGQNLQGFFIQWLESTGAPEFTIEYTVLRTQKGFTVRGKITNDLDTFRMPVDLKIETEGNPEMKRVEVVGQNSEFQVDSFGKPKKVIIDPEGRVLRLSPSMRVAVAIRRGEQLAEVGEYGEALREYQKALDVNRGSSLAHYRVGEVFFLQGNYQSAVNEFREALNGDGEPKWTEVWARIKMGNVFDISNQRDRAVNEYTQAIRTKDNTQGAQEEAAKYLKSPYVRPDKN